MISSLLAKFSSFIPNIFALLNKQAVQSVMCEEITSYAIETSHFMFIVIRGLQDRNSGGATLFCMLLRIQGYYYHTMHTFPEM